MVVLVEFYGDNEVAFFNQGYSSTSLCIFGLDYTFLANRAHNWAWDERGVPRFKWLEIGLCLWAEVSIFGLEPLLRANHKNNQKSVGLDYTFLVNHWPSWAWYLEV